MNANLATALQDLTEAIQDITLGSVEHVVIESAGTALIRSWNDHNDDKIDEAAAIDIWLNN